jgi:hypothetical protein
VAPAIATVTPDMIISNKNRRVSAAASKHSQTAV